MFHSIPNWMRQSRVAKPQWQKVSDKNPIITEPTSCKQRCALSKGFLLDVRKLFLPLRILAKENGRTGAAACGRKRITQNARHHNAQQLMRKAPLTLSVSKLVAKGNHIIAQTLQPSSPHRHPNFSNQVSACCFFLFSFSWSSSRCLKHHPPKLHCSEATKAEPPGSTHYTYIYTYSTWHHHHDHLMKPHTGK